MLGVCFNIGGVKMIETIVIFVLVCIFIWTLCQLAWGIWILSGWYIGWQVWDKDPVIAFWIILVWFLCVLCSCSQREEETEVIKVRIVK